MKLCHFDNTETRTRRKNNKFSPIMELWDMYVKRSMDLYSIGECGTVDEMLLRFRGKCGFCQYVPSKLGLYGINFWVLTDSASHYCYNIISYIGKEGDKLGTNHGAKVVKDLAVPIFGSRINITCARYFTSVTLFEELPENRLTTLGTVMANHKHLPLQLLLRGENSSLGSSMFAYKEKVTMVS